MGRYPTGIITKNQATRLELSYLIKNGYIKKNCFITGSISWTSGSSINIETKYTNKEKYIRLIYSVIDKNSQEQSFDYKIKIKSIPSNLGKGEILYFVCPELNILCRVLYKAYNSRVWKSREAYKKRIYYPDQIESKRFRMLKNLFNDEVLENLYSKQKKSHYRGKPTRLMNKIKKREAKNSYNFKEKNELFLAMLYK